MRTTVASDTRLLGIGRLALMKMVAERRREGVVKLWRGKDRWKDGGEERGWTSTTPDSGRYTNLISRKWTSRLAGSVHRSIQCVCNGIKCVDTFHGRWLFERERPWKGIARSYSVCISRLSNPLSPSLVFPLCDSICGINDNEIRAKLE